MQVQPSGVLCRALDRGIEVELLGHALAREAAQPPQRDLYVARVELDRIIEIAERAFVPYLDCAAVAAAFLADPHAFGVVAVGAERARARGADPLRTALMTAALLLHALLQDLHQ